MNVHLCDINLVKDIDAIQQRVTHQFTVLFEGHCGGTEFHRETIVLDLYASSEAFLKESQESPPCSQRRREVVEFPWPLLLEEQGSVVLSMSEKGGGVISIATREMTHSLFL